MAVKGYKPTTPSRRYMTTSTFDEVTRAESERSLTEGISKRGGRNNKGRITKRRTKDEARRFLRVSPQGQSRVEMPGFYLT